MEQAYGSHQAFQIDTETALKSPVLYITAGGKLMKFVGATKQFPDGLQIWEGRTEDMCYAMHLTVRPDGTFNGSFGSVGHRYEVYSTGGSGTGVIRERFGHPTRY